MKLYTHTILLNDEDEKNNFINKNAIESKKDNSNKAITLIALIISIVVLLILSGVTILALRNTGIIDKAKLTRNKYQNVADEENKILNNYERAISRASRNEPEISKEEVITNFDYNGEEKIYTAPVSGYYLLECWGAQGGNSFTKTGGYGGYSSGIIYLDSKTKLYVNIGGKGLGNGSHTYRKGGYNGGGDATLVMVTEIQDKPQEVELHILHYKQEFYHLYQIILIPY